MPIIAIQTIPPKASSVLRKLIEVNILNPNPSAPPVNSELIAAIVANMLPSFNPVKINLPEDGMIR
jgi:hypothetical protein